MGRLIDKTVPKFLLVGVVNTLVGAGVMFLLFNLANWSYWAASAANYLAGGVVSFFLNKHFTFQNKERSWLQVIRFAATVAVCWVIAYAVAKPLVAMALAGQGQKIQENLAMVAGMCLYTGLNYLGQRFFAFKQREKE
jgi:putative flippase GtrA